MTENFLGASGTMRMTSSQDVLAAKMGGTPPSMRLTGRQEAIPTFI
jgi:hypothetical protein